MNVRITARPLNCDRLTVWPSESRKVKSGAVLGGVITALAAKSVRAGAVSSPTETVEEEQLVSATVTATTTSTAAVAPGIAASAPEGRMRDRLILRFSP